MRNVSVRARHDRYETTTFVVEDELFGLFAVQNLCRFGLLELDSVFSPG
jgi:hypothetical protein